MDNVIRSYDQKTTLHFSGGIIRYDLNYFPVDNQIFINGKPTGQYAKLSNLAKVQTSVANESSSTSTDGEYHCYELYYCWGYYGYPASEQCVFLGYSDSCWDFPTGPSGSDSGYGSASTIGGSSPYGGNPPTSSNITMIVTNNLIDPCKNAAYSAITDTKIKNFITGYFNNFLAPQNSTVDLVISEANNLTANGHTVPAYSTKSSTPGSNSWEIKLSSNYFTGTDQHMSKEAWGMIIAHEILHICIGENGLSSLGNDHALIFKSFVNPTRDLLMEAFGLSSTEATKLALTGIKDLWSYPDFNDKSVELYGVNNAEVDATYNKYTKDEVGGTKCNTAN